MRPEKLRSMVLQDRMGDLPAIWEQAGQPSNVHRRLS